MVQLITEGDLFRRLFLFPASVVGIFLARAVLEPDHTFNHRARPLHRPPDPPALDTGPAPSQTVGNQHWGHGIALFLADDAIVTEKPWATSRCKPRNNLPGYALVAVVCVIDSLLSAGLTLK